MSLFDPGPVVPGNRKSLSADAKRTLKRQRILDAGVNPASMKPFADNGETCGTCAHLQANRRAKTYYKCGLFLVTGGPGTDLRVSWPACVLWAAGD